MNLKICFIMSSLLASIICDVKRVQIPTSLRRCLRKRDKRLLLTDEQISTSCLLQFQWSNRKPCDKVSKQTFDWLSSLVEKSQQRPSVASLQGSGNSVNRPKRQTTGSQLRQRKEYRMLTDQERADYLKAINDLKRDTSVQPNKYDALAIYHKNTLHTAHNGIGFVGWHRYYLVMYELALQEKNPNVMLPYWDSTLDSEMHSPTDTIVFTDKFLGKAHGTVSEPFIGWPRQIIRSVNNDQLKDLITKAELADLFDTKTDHWDFVNSLESLHNGVHRWVGGDMKNLDIAPFDPIFYMHHAFIDCIWETYRDLEKQRGGSPEIYPGRVSDSLDHQSFSLMANLPPFNNVNLTNADGYKNFWTETYYTCAPQPWCSVKKSKCGSKWLDCDIFEGKCVSKGSAAALPSVTPGEVFEIHNRRFPTSPVNNGFNRKLPLPPGRKLNFQSGASGRPGPTGLSTGVSGRKITAEEFFSALKTLKKQPISISNTPIVRNRSGTHGNHGSPGISSNINNKHSPQQMPSIDELKIPKFHKPCAGNPIQNTFRLDCGVGKSLWVFVPVKVVNLRHGDTVYPSYPVNMEGRTLNDSDVFSDGQPLAFASNLHSKARSKKKSCIYDKSGLFKVRVSSYGLNYLGIYEDTVFLDNKRTVSTEISYIGIKHPEQNATKVFITAIDECGIACQPMILIPGRQKRRFFRYRKTQGAIEITAKGKQYYSSTYRGAESLVWSSAKFSVPQQDENQIPIVFVCDYRKKNPWS